MEMVNDSPYQIFDHYQAEYRGIVQYYLLAQNLASLTHLHYTMQMSLLKTLAVKHKASVKEMTGRYHAEVQAPHGTMKCLKVEVPREEKPPLVAIFGGIPLRRKQTARITNTIAIRHWRRTDGIKRLLADECELCGSRDGVQIHHIRRLNDLKKPGRREKPEWMKHMIAMRRKTLAVCKRCHVNIHAGRPLNHE
jgi:hypothetical protein